jgi:hypothetical protein
MVDNEAYIDIMFFTQHDEWNNILKFGTPYVEQPVYKIVTAFCENSMSLVQCFTM